MLFICYSVHIFWAWQKCMLYLLCLVQSKYAKIQKQENPFIGLNVLKFFCVSLYSEFLYDIYKKFQVASICDTNVDYQIWCFWCNLFLSCADNRQTHAHTHKSLKILFSDSGNLKTCKFIKISTSKICPKNNTFSTDR